jgi:hypothetical protein
MDSSSGLSIKITGLGLGVGAYDPMKANLAAAQGVEGLGQNVLNQGLEMGGLRTRAATQGAEGAYKGSMAGAESRFQAAMSPTFGQSLLGGLANAGLNYATGGLSGAAGFDITGQQGASQLGNYAMQGLGQYFGPGQATTAQTYAPANQGFYQQAAQPSSYGSPSQYPGLNWANI